jgi:hypothetical protein
MKNTALTALLLGGILATQLNAAPIKKNEQPPPPSVTPVKETVKTQEQKLHLANPFFLPNAGDFQFAFSLSMTQTRVRSDAPAQNFVGIALPASYKETTGTAYGATLTARYGFFDRFIGGVSADVYVPQEGTTTQGGSSSTSFASLQLPKGFASPELSVYGRFAGTRPGQFYLDAGVIFRTGVGSSEVNALGVGRTAFTGSVITGMNFKFITLGVGGSVQYAPATSLTQGSRTASVTDSKSAAAAVVAQTDWNLFYLRGTFTYVRSLNADASNPASRSGILTFGAGTGVKFTDNMLLDVNYAFSPELTGDLYYTGYISAFQQSNTIGPTHRLTVGFSLRL